MALGDGLPAADVGAVTVVWTTAGLLEEIPALVWAAWACVARAPVGWACAAWAPAKVSSVTITAAATHTATAVVAIATPGLARMPFQLTRLIACENIGVQVDSARRITRRRYAAASSEVEEQRLTTLSRSSAGSGASGSRPERTVGRSEPRA